MAGWLRVSLFVLCAFAALLLALLMLPDVPPLLQLTLGPTEPITTQKRQRFERWLRAAGAASAQLSWRQDGVAGSGLFALEVGGKRHAALPR